MTLDPTDALLISGLLPDERIRHGVPSPARVARHEAAVAAAEEAVGHLLVPGGLRISPLGPGWSNDIDLHASARPPSRLLLDLGWLPLDALLQRVGSRGEGRWAIVVDGGLVAADLTTDRVPEPLTALTRRASRHGEVRIREVVELRVLQRQGVVLPAGDPVVEMAAGLEAALGGEELRRFLPPRSSPPPARLPAPIRRTGADSLRGNVASLRRAVRRRPVVGFSGVDGSGKSSLTRRIAGELNAVGVPTSIVWTRPGMRLRTLAVSARLAHSALGIGPEPVVRSVASGGPGPATRKGQAAWLWAVCVSGAFACDVRRRHSRARGLVLYDRHLLDALVTLDFVYGGVDLRLARWIVRRAVPTAFSCLYVDVPPEVALARKPGDTFGEHAIERQLEEYAARRSDFPGMIPLDGRRSLDELAIEALRHVAAAAGSGSIAVPS